MKTDVYNLKDADRKWYVVDASGEVLGRLATRVADILRGKNKPIYTPNLDVGDNVIVLNAAKVVLSREAKKGQKKYYRHSGYPGGIKEESFEEAIAKHPERVIELAIKGMMPKNKLAKVQKKRLKVYSGADHPHTQELFYLEGAPESVNKK
ncbi:MAG: 50S ribosomal protein L13 [Patescibacteria group bacterium]|nr:50S ribosomal protein L13 [Patescibacteria group bacterium]